MLAKEAFSYDDLLLIPQRSRLKSRSEVSLKTKITKNIEINIPIISANMDSVTDSNIAIEMALLGGVGAIHRVMDIDSQIAHIKKVKDYDFERSEYPLASIDSGKKLIVGSSLGVRENTLKNLEQIIKAGSDFVIIDVAHAHSERVLEIVKNIKKEYKDDIDLIVGNIATKEAAEDFIDIGVDAIKIGIGPGSICTTRIVTGVGVPQASAIDWIYEITKDTNIPLIADGGIRSSGDIVKALALGASSVMIGGMIARCNEAPGENIKKDGKLYKYYRGEASLHEMKKRFKIDKRVNIDNITPEGIEGLVEVEYSLNNLLTKLTGGIRSGLSYMDAFNIKELQSHAKFVKITNAGLIESNFHDINKV